ncbi:unnamed protein product [Blepharisma stoltei]|uniref:Uncharacterized protein n=1 Tax=Blepharisma stoltei TaxID=1481888 RepID=A0AAU9JTJ0_9CILI|nr:unnamed protein product [Blepharisma stoltei]
MADFPYLRERSLSSMEYAEYKKIRVHTSSPEMRPLEAVDFPPPISLAPSEMDTCSQTIHKLLKEKEEDQHLIKILKSHSLQQVKELEELQEKYSQLMREYDDLNSRLKEPKNKEGLIYQAVLARSRSSSLNENVE